MVDHFLSARPCKGETPWDEDQGVRASRLLTLVALLALSACATGRPVVPTATPRTVYGGAPVVTTYTGPCAEPRAAAQAADINRASIDTLPVTPFGHAETGWRTYAPLTAQEIRVICPYDSPGFAEALARWKAERGLAYDGVMDGATLEKLKGVWQEKRPFLMGRVRKEPCPAAPDPASLVFLDPTESHYGKPIALRPATLEAYRRMAAAARSELGPAVSPPPVLTLFSAFRSPDYDKARCAVEGGCNGVARAGSCSAHRTGLAIDIVLGSAPGYRVDNAADANRLWQSQTPLYHWLVINAARFGFVNYPYEPWHWEWTGEVP